MDPLMDMRFKRTKAALTLSLLAMIAELGAPWMTGRVAAPSTRSVLWVRE